jgi:pyruvate/2-oxoacid:ferredoxin oxidoreductase beta subunit
LIVDVSDEALQMSFGLARSIAQKHLEKVRNVRRGGLLNEHPSDLPGQLMALDHLSWEDLTGEERAGCPPVLVFSDESALTKQGLAGLEHILSSNLPIKLVVLDSRGISDQFVEPSLLGLAHQRAFVLVGSIAHREHLFDGLKQALRFGGSALIHLHVPIPGEQGYPPANTLERARLAVGSRIHPLLLFDPSIEGVLGTRVSLEGNPDPESEWSNVTPFEWVLGEQRFRRRLKRAPEDAKLEDAVAFIDLPAEDRGDVLPVVSDPRSGDQLVLSPELVRMAERRRQIWNVYREISGLESPFVNRIYDRVKVEIEQEHKDSVEEMKKQYETRLEEMQRNVDGQMAAQLRQRLLRLAGFDPSSTTRNE